MADKTHRAARDDGPPVGGGFPPPDGGLGLDGLPPFGGGGFGPGGSGRGGPGGPGGPMQQETKLVKQFDKNGDGWLNAEERKAAREYLKTQGGGRRFGGPGGRQAASLKSFAEKRRAYLLNHVEVKKAAK